MTNKLQQNYPQFFELNGTALNDGYIYIGVDGLDPTTNPIPVYLDASLTTPISQPLRTTGGYVYYNGNPVSIYFGASNYSITVKNSLSSLIYTNLSAYTMPFINTAMVVENIAELKTFSNAEANQIEVLGYYTKGDGGGGLFYWDGTSTEADNGGTIIRATGVTTGRWKRVFSGAINVKWFGAKGDGTSPSINKSAIENAISMSNHIDISDGEFLSDPIFVTKSILHISGSGILKLNTGAIEVLLTINGFTNCIIDGITFEGNRDTTGEVSGLRKRLLQLDSQYGFGTVNNCTFRKGIYGGFSIDSAYSCISNNLVYDCGIVDGSGDGISVVSFYPKETIIFGNKVIGASDYGIAVDAVNAKVSNNYIEGARSAGLGSLARFYGGVSLGRNMVFENNTIKNCKNPMNFFSGDSDSPEGFVGLTIDKNFIDGGTSTNSAISIVRDGTVLTTAGHNIKITNNQIKGTSISQGISIIGKSTLTGTTYDILIDGNTIDTEKPIILEGCSDYIVTNNLCSYQGAGYGTRGIRLTNCYGGNVFSNRITKQDVGILVNNSDVNLYGNEYINIQSKGLLINTGIVDIREHFKNIGQRPLLIDTPTFGDYRSVITGAITFTKCSSINTGTAIVMDIYDPAGNSHDIRFDYIHNYPDHTTGYYALCPYIRNPTSANQRIEISDAIGCKLDAEVIGSNLRKGATTPTSKYWKAGTKTIITEPTAGSYIGAICIVSGTPGTWKSFGAISA